MKIFPVLFTALALCAVSALAQEDGPGLIPDIPAPGKKPKAQPAAGEKKSSTEQAGDDLASRIRYREAKTKAMQEPKIQAEWDRAHAAKTEREKREALKSFYTMLYDRVIALDHSVKPRAEAARKTLAWRLDQRGIKPSEAVESEDDGPALGRN